MVPDPMLCRSSRRLPSGDGRVLEPKWDGYRILFSVGDGRVACHTRHARSHTGRFPYVERPLREALGPGTIVDGEIVSLARRPDGSVGQDFERLGPIFAGPIPHEPEECGLFFVAFDVLCHAGENLRSCPWQERRAILEAALPERHGHVSVTPTASCSVESHERHLRLGFEGSVAKKRNGRYLPGRRGWLKIKARRELTATVVGVSHGRNGDELRVRCASPTLGELGWAEVWTPAVREALNCGALAPGATVRLAYSSRTPVGRVREAHAVAIA
jgi:ATP-dependent DNA ligase